MADDLGDRMKQYENVYRHSLVPGLPIVVRIDGKAFHTWTRRVKMKRPFDERMVGMMDQVGVKVCSEMMNARLAYLQSDEISVVMMRGQQDSQDWFGGTIQKIVSVAASVATQAASQVQWVWTTDPTVPMFDARVFTLPNLTEVVNYLIWRQQDWVRNSVQMLARSLYGQKQLEGADQARLHDMIFQKGQNWNDLPTHLRRGRCCWRMPRVVTDGCVRHSWVADHDIPIFTEDRDWILRKLVPDSTDKMCRRCGANLEEPR